MKAESLVSELIRSHNYSAFLQHTETDEQQLREILRDYFPRLNIGERLSLEALLRDEEAFNKLQKLLEVHQQVLGRSEWLQQQSVKVRAAEESGGGGKKVTRAAMARRLQKNQEEIKKDQIFVRLTPKSQACIQFMLCNRNFPRMECKLSCNQHLEYLVNYLTNKWIRGKVGSKVVLFPDASFLKHLPLPEKEKAHKEPLNNYLMFTDIMACCGVHQNGVLNLTYDILEVKKLPKPAQTHAALPEPAPAYSLPDPFTFPLMKEKPKGVEASEKREKERNGKEEYMREASVFNRNSNFFGGGGEESLFGSLGFNFGFGLTPSKKEEHMLSINSINYLDPHFHRQQPAEEHPLDFPLKEEEDGSHNIEEKSMVEHDRKEREERSKDKRDNGGKREERREERSEKKSQKSERGEEGEADRKLGTLMSFLQLMQKQKDNEGKPQQSQNNNSNRFKEVKTVSIVKKRNKDN